MERKHAELRFLPGSSNSKKRSCVSTRSQRSCSYLLQIDGRAKSGTDRTHWSLNPAKSKCVHDGGTDMPDTVQCTTEGDSPWFPGLWAENSFTFPCNITNLLLSPFVLFLSESQICWCEMLATSVLG